MKLDRELQLKILQGMADCYPMKANPCLSAPDVDHHTMQANLCYLLEHGLISGSVRTPLNPPIPQVINPAISAKGQDFLADDGGLSAILGVVEVKIHADTIRELIGKTIDESDLPREEKSAIKKHIEDLPSSTLAHLTNKLVDLGLQNAPLALVAIQKALSGG